jgi:tRNA-Thr(GGU) m(6)t(6)A37 methyltransferase TsaA
MGEHFTVQPVGAVRRQGDRSWIEIYEAYRDALLGLEGFSHIYVLYWFHENDSPEKRATLRVHPRKDPKNPLTGVFATHSPMRPNLLGLTCCRVTSVEGNLVWVEGIDAFDGSPVIDIKCYIPDAEPKSGIHVPRWVHST